MEKDCKEIYGTTKVKVQTLTTEKRGLNNSAGSGDGRSSTLALSAKLVELWSPTVV